MILLPGVPWRALAVLVAAVVALHALVLQSAPTRWGWPSRSAPATLTLRALATPDPAQPEPVAAAATPPLRPTAAAAPARSRATSAQAGTGPAPVPTPAQVAAAAAAQAEVTVPASFRSHYAVTGVRRGMPVNGSAQLAFRRDGLHYEATLRIDAPPLLPRLQRSAGRIGLDGLAPSRFADRLRSEEAVHFDRDAASIVFSSNRPAAPLRPGAQDRLSVLVQLGGLLARAMLEPGDVVLVQTATTREAEDWRFRFDGEDSVALPGGPVQALKLTRAPQREWEPRLEVWYLPGRDYGPVRLRLTPPHGDWLEMQWSGTDKG